MAWAFNLNSYWIKYISWVIAIDTNAFVPKLQIVIQGMMTQACNMNAWRIAWATFKAIQDKARVTK